MRVHPLDDSRPLWIVMALFLIPLVMGNVLQALSSTFNSIFLGRLIGVNSLAAVSSLFPILFFLISFLIGLATGSTVLVGQAYGARDNSKVKAVAGTTLCMGAVLGVAVGLLGAFFAGDVLRLVGTPANIMADALAYSRFMFISLPIIFVFLIYTSLLRGTGDAKTPFWFLALSTALAILLTPAFIRGWLGLPTFGTTSAAVAALLANGVGLLALIVYLGRTNHPLAFDRETQSDLRIKWPLLKQVARIGIPSGLQLVMISLSEIAVISFVNRFGSHATAAYGAVNQVVSYVSFPAISVGIAGSIFGAQSIGAGKQERLRSVVHTAVGLNYAIGGILIGTVYLFSWPILGWFITDPGTLGIAHRLLMITLWSYLLFGNASVLGGIMRSSGTVLWPTAVTIASIWLVEVPVAYVLSYKIGISGIWVGYPCAFVVALILQSTYYFLVWKKRTHVRLI